MAHTSKTKTVRGTGVREASAQATRDSILKAATRIFARYGYDGGSIEKISSLAKSHDRMIYYYFGSKEGLFIAVLEGIYQRMDEAEAKAAPVLPDAVEALTALIRFKVAYYRRHPEFVTLLNTENLHKGRHVAKSQKATQFSSNAVDLIAGILERGVAQGRFRPGLRPRDIYLLIVSTAYFFTSNRFTISAFLGESLERPGAVEEWADFVVDSVLRVVRAQAD
ncbi:TetR/AcrR family transcriptional regulator [Roseateles sp. UC29_93]|uniref:TetR/AcrR family transcriptional regulator n=1 Tax=Roseateles sp. UC29_93 TaxID=3350177 RepID=UPI0002D454E8